MKLKLQEDAAEFMLFRTAGGSAETSYLKSV